MSIPPIISSLREIKLRRTPLRLSVYVCVSLTVTLCPILFPVINNNYMVGEGTSEARLIKLGLI
jgi:hypothetical protein